MRTLRVPVFFFLSEKYLSKSVSFIRKIIISRPKSIALDFSNLKDSTKGDLMVFQAQIEKAILEYKKTFYLKGKFPPSKRIKKLMQVKGKILHENKRLPANLLDAEKDMLLRPTFIEEIVKDLKKIGIKEFFTPFNVYLTEIIGNAVEHGIENRKINWWLTQDVDRHNELMRYTFVDMGKGIIESHKDAKIPFKYWFFSDSKIVLDSLYGRLGSSTKKPNRGKGLPQLRNLIEMEIVSNLIIITNTVNIKYVNGKFLSKKNPNFVGTYYSWTINIHNYAKWKTSLLKSHQTSVQG